MKHAVISSYDLPNQWKIVRVEQRDLNYKWVVRNGRVCLKKTGLFEYEPLPSNRTQDFLDETRFDSPEEAYSSWEAHVHNQVMTRSLLGLTIRTDATLPKGTIKLVGRT